jgi:hypothetical protein
MANLLSKFDELLCCYMRAWIITLVRNFSDQINTFPMYFLSANPNSYHTYFLWFDFL